MSASRSTRRRSRAAAPTAAEASGTHVVALRDTPARRGAPAANRLFDEFAVDRLYTALTHIPDADMLLRQRGISRAGLRILETDDEITAALETRCDAVLGTPWRLEAGENGLDEESDEVAWLWAELAPHMEGLLRCAWRARPYGYSVGETVYQPRNDFWSMNGRGFTPGADTKQDGTVGLVGIDRFAEKPLEWFTPTPGGQLFYAGNGFVLTAADLTSQALDTEHKFFLTRCHPTYRQPHGEALLSRLYWAWYFRHNAWRFWMQFLERFGDPIIMGKVLKPAQFVEEIQKLGLQAVLAVGKDESVEAVTTSAQGEFSAIERALCERVQKTILGQTLTTSIGPTGGAFSAAQVHDGVRLDKWAADLRLAQPTVQRQAAALWKLNREASLRLGRDRFGGACPTVVLADESGLETERAKRDGELVKSGAIKLLPAYFQRTYDYEEGEFLVPGAPTEGTGGEAGAGGAGGTDPTTGAAIPGDATSVQETALNGAQIDALRDIVADVAAGRIPKESAKAMLRSGFPSFDDEEIGAIIDPIVVDTSPPPAPPAAGDFPPAAPSPDAPPAAPRSRRASARPPQQQQVEHVGDLALGDAGSPVEEEAIRRAVRAASSEADFRRRLAILLQDLHPARFEAAVRRGVIAAQVLGYVHAEDAAPVAKQSAAEAAELKLLEVLARRIERLA